MALSIAERAALAAYERAQTGIRNTITNGVLPNTKLVLSQYGAFSEYMADPDNAWIAAQYAGETAEIGITAEDVAGLVAQLQATITAIYAIDAKAGGKLFYLEAQE